MGYYTQYSGALEITPPLTKAEYQRLAQVLDFWNSEEIIKAATADVFESGLALMTAADKKLQPEKDWERDCTFLLSWEWITALDEDVKGYQNRETLAIAAQWLEENGHELSGSMGWQGSSNEDSGTIYAARVEGHNRIEFVDDLPRVNPGPSWQPREQEAKTEVKS